MRRCDCDLLEYGRPTTVKTGSVSRNLLSLPPVSPEGVPLALAPHFTHASQQESSIDMLLKQIQNQQEEIRRSVNTANQKLAEDNASLRGIVQDFHAQVLAAISGLGAKKDALKESSNGDVNGASDLLDSSAANFSRKDSGSSAQKYPRGAPSQGRNVRSKAPEGSWEDTINWKELPETWPLNLCNTKADSSDSSGSAHLLRCWCLFRSVSEETMDCCMSLVIVVNLLTMFMQLQLRENYTEYKLGLRADAGGWDDIKNIFQVMEYVYCMIFLLECAFRFAVLGLPYLQDWFNVFDLVVVIITAFETMVLPVFDISNESTNISLLRLTKIFRSVRLLKVIERSERFHELRVLLRTLIMSYKSLLWSMLLVSSVIVAGGILMVQLASDFMHNKDNNLSDRMWVYDNFGTSARSTYTMFESTFTTGWPVYAQRMWRRVNGFFALFWVLWTITINFAVMRVIAALFLKQTMAVASEDADRMAISKVQQKGRFAAQIRTIFEKADTSGDGGISAGEFKAMIYEREICEAFIKLDLELYEVITLFRLLADDDGIADYDEFLQGAMKLKNSASTIDVIQILHEHAKLRKEVEQISFQLTGLGSPRMASSCRTKPLS